MVFRSSSVKIFTVPYSLRPRRSNLRMSGGWTSGLTDRNSPLALGDNFLPKFGGTSVYINPFSACLFDRIKSPLTISSQRILGDAGEIVRDQRRGKIQTRWRSQLSINSNRSKFRSERTGVCLKRSLILKVTIIDYISEREPGDRPR